MDALQIQDMRAMLAAQTALSEKRAPSLTRKLKRLLAAKSPPVASAPPSIPAEPSTATLAYSLESDYPLEMDDDTPVLLSGEVMSPVVDPIPPQLLLGDLAPRRPAFGQRSEAVLELSEAVPVKPRRLTLLAADGAAVGEIILHADDIGPAKTAEGLGRFEPLHCEVPFFPGDLADEPRSPHVIAPKKSAPPSSPPPPPPELAATFLLATLAARLASEEASLHRRLSVVRSSALAA